MNIFIEISRGRFIKKALPEKPIYPELSSTKPSIREVEEYKGKVEAYNFNLNVYDNETRKITEYNNNIVTDFENAIIEHYEDRYDLEKDHWVLIHNVLTMTETYVDSLPDQVEFVRKFLDIYFAFR